MSKIQQLGVCLIGAFVIALGLVSGKAVFGQKEENPPDVLNPGPFEFTTREETDKIGRVAQLAGKFEGLSFSLKMVKRSQIQSRDLLDDLEMRQSTSTTGLSAREIAVAREELESRRNALKEKLRDGEESLRVLMIEVAAQKLELVLLMKKNGFPNLEPSNDSETDQKLSDIERTLKAMQTKPADVAK